MTPLFLDIWSAATYIGFKDGKKLTNDNIEATMNNDNWGQSYKLDNDKNAIGQLLVMLDIRGQN